MHIHIFDVISAPELLFVYWLIYSLLFEFFIVYSFIDSPCAQHVCDVMGYNDNIDPFQFNFGRRRFNRHRATEEAISPPPPIVFARV